MGKRRIDERDIMLSRFLLDPGRELVYGKWPAPERLAGWMKTGGA